ncbi:MAG: gamma-glutamylcyclotransferase family protein [Pseudomonadota bacterium]
MTGPEYRLATYGTLAPGEVNAHQLDGLNGVWSKGRIRGKLIAEGWGADHGCPGIRLAEDGEAVEAHIFTSRDLPDHWPRLDEFEGAEYRRTATMAETEDGPVQVFVYELAA